MSRLTVFEKLKKNLQSHLLQILGGNTDYFLSAKKYISFQGNLWFNYFGDKLAVAT